MEQFFSPSDFNHAMAQRECFLQAESRMQREHRHLQGKTPAQQRAHLQSYRSGAIQAISDWLGSMNPLSKETDQQAVDRMLGQMRRAEERRCR